MADAHVCPRYHKAVELIGRRWNGTIVQTLLRGRARYCEIRQAVPDISDRMLAERLRELEAEGVLVREVHASTPVRVEYELTEKGRALEDAVTAISRWAEAWIEPTEAVATGGATEH
jgi:DNA-binding HxlR family transcriptional regulator